MIRLPDLYGFRRALIARQQREALRQFRAACARQVAQVGPGAVSLQCFAGEDAARKAIGYDIQAEIAGYALGITPQGVDVEPGESTVVQTSLGPVTVRSPWAALESLCDPELQSWVFIEDRGACVRELVGIGLSELRENKLTPQSLAILERLWELGLRA